MGRAVTEEVPFCVGVEVAIEAMSTVQVLP